MRQASDEQPGQEAIERAQARRARGERLGLKEGTALYGAWSVGSVGRFAEEAALRRCGRRVQYRVNRHIHAGNVCEVRCDFCGFHRVAGQAGAYVRRPEEIAEEAAKAADMGATQVHIVGGIWEGLTPAYGEEVVRLVKAACGELAVRAWTATEIAVMAERAEVTVEAVLARLIEAGLGSLPGGGAEILDEEYFARHCPGKPGPAVWEAVHRAAHRLGLNTGATMLFGYDETVEQRVKHLLRVRAVQDEALAVGKGRFGCFVPLPYVGPGGRRQDAAEVLRTIAVARLMLDNVEHVKAFWPMLGVELAQVALGFGADDLEGTVRTYEIVEGKAEDGMSVERLEGLIREAQREPELVRD